MTPASLVAEPSSVEATPAKFHRIFSFPAALAALLLMLAVLTVRERFEDPDMWWHLKTGQIIVSTHHIPQADFFSYTTNHHSYIPHEWLSQILIYASYAAHGLSGLMFWECAFTVAILLAGFGLCTLYSGNPKLGFLGAMVIWCFGTVGFAIRPQMVGYLLLVFEVIVLHLGRTRNARWFCFLPPLFAVWVNCHGSFSFGIAVAGTYFLSSFFTLQSGFVIAERWTPQARRTLGVCLSLSLLALLLNPTGIELVLYPIKTLFLPSSSIAAVAEWQPLQFDEFRGFALLAVFTCVVALPGNTRARIYLQELILLVAATYLALTHVRLLFPFGIIIAPIVTRMLASIWHDDTREQTRPLANAVLIALACAAAYAGFPSYSELQKQVRNVSAVGAVDFIKSQHFSGPMLNEWMDGGYLIWALPEHPVFIDGRADIYDWAGVTPQFKRWATLSEPPNLLLDKYHVQFCLLRSGSPMVNAVALIPGWTKVYSDQNSIVFVRPSLSKP